jgi:hypothetical protein
VSVENPKGQMFQKSRGAIIAAALRTFPAILTDAGKVSKVALGDG